MRVCAVGLTVSMRMYTVPMLAITGDDGACAGDDVTSGSRIKRRCVRWVVYCAQRLPNKTSVRALGCSTQRLPIERRYVLTAGGPMLRQDAMTGS